MRVAIVCRNGMPFVYAIFSLMRLGAVCVPLNWRLTPSELSAQLEHADAAWLLYDESCSTTCHPRRGCARCALTPMLRPCRLSRHCPRPRAVLTRPALYTLPEPVTARAASCSAMPICWPTAPTTALPAILRPDRENSQPRSCFTYPRFRGFLPTCAAPQPAI